MCLPLLKALLSLPALVRLDLGDVWVSSTPRPPLEQPPEPLEPPESLKSAWPSWPPLPPGHRGLRWLRVPLTGRSEFGVHACVLSLIRAHAATLVALVVRNDDVSSETSPEDGLAGELRRCGLTRSLRSLTLERCGGSKKCPAGGKPCRAQLRAVRAALRRCRATVECNRCSNSRSDKPAVFDFEVDIKCVHDPTENELGELAWELDQLDQ